LLFESGKNDEVAVETFKGLSEIHEFLFEAIHSFAGQVREVNFSKRNFRFAPMMY
jgi:cell filamentation protein